MLVLDTEFLAFIFFFTYGSTKPHTAFAGNKIIIISMTARIAKLIALSSFVVIIPSPNLMTA
jgi:hypothetical protein